MSPACRIASAGLDAARGALEVRWADGHESTYPLAYLRSSCPCAACRTERDQAKANPFRVLSGRPPSAVVAGIEPVGRYGMRIRWEDGHDAGIFTFEHLRELCPCDECRARGPRDEPPMVHGIHIPSEGERGEE